MRRRWRGCAVTIALACSALALTLTPAAAVDSSAAVDRFATESMAANALPGLAVAITHGDEIVHLAAYGTDGHGRPLTTDTQMFIGSLSKSFTALAVMQLVETGEVELDAPVQTYLPDFRVADPDARITVAQLLHHTSGLADTGYPEMTRPQPADLDERVRALRNARLVSPPGTDFHYFDANYAVLARIVETVSGLPFGTYLRRHIFDPVGMRDSTAVVVSQEAPRAAPRLARGHITPFGVALARDELPGVLAGSGGVISTAGDMAAYVMMHASGGRAGGTAPLSPDGLERMRTPGPAAGTYGMGWMATEPGVVEHNGVLSTFYAHMAVRPADGYGVVLMTNSYNALASYDAIVDGLLDIATGRPAPAVGMGARGIGWIVAAVTVITTALLTIGLHRLPVWAIRRRRGPRWRAAAGIIWTPLPALLLVLMPQVVALASGRVFSHRALYRAMPSIMLWLTLTALLALALGGGRASALTHSDDALT